MRGAAAVAVVAALALGAAAPVAGQGGAADPGGCVATAQRPIVIPGPRGIDAVHGTVVFACIGNVDEVHVTASLTRGGRIRVRTYDGPPPFGVRRRVSVVMPCVRSVVPRPWYTLHSLFARNENGSDRQEGQSRAAWLRCRAPRRG